MALVRRCFIQSKACTLECMAFTGTPDVPKCAVLDAAASAVTHISLLVKTYRNDVIERGRSAPPPEVR